MSSIFLVSVIGQDKLNTLNSLADLTHSHQGKWLSNRVVKLEGLFSSIIKIEVPTGEKDALQTALKAMPDLQLTIYPVGEASTEESTPAHLVIDAEDRPGLIHDITALLVEHGIQVNKMECNRLSVPEAGGNVFNAELDILIPDGVSTSNVTAEIEKLKPRVMVTQS